MSLELPGTFARGHSSIVAREDTTFALCWTCDIQESLAATSPYPEYSVLDMILMVAPKSVRFIKLPRAIVQEPVRCTVLRGATQSYIVIMDVFSVGEYAILIVYTSLGTEPEELELQKPLKRNFLQFSRSYIVPLKTLTLSHQ